jgi:hypothetical protein
VSRIFIMNGASEASLSVCSDALGLDVAEYARLIEEKTAPQPVAPPPDNTSA